MPSEAPLDRRRNDHWAGGAPLILAFAVIRYLIQLL
jgi:hypothetical protein